MVVGVYRADPLFILPGNNALHFISDAIQFNYQIILGGRWPARVLPVWNHFIGVTVPSSVDLGE